MKMHLIYCTTLSPVQKTYLKNVKVKRIRKSYDCCKGWAPYNGECVTRKLIIVALTTKVFEKLLLSFF